MQSIDPRSFRNALGAFTTGVTIVTTQDRDGNDIGMTANSFNSVSLDPPLVLWSLAKSSLSRDAFMEAEYFAVHILAEDQQPLSDQFSKRGIDKFAGLALARGHGKVPLIDGCSARFECRTSFRYEGGDHIILVGEVVEFEHFERLPLVFQAGKYAIALQKPAPKVRTEDNDGSFSHDSLTYLAGNLHFLMDRQFRAALKHHGLNQRQIYAISLLGAESAQTSSTLIQATEFTGNPITEADITDLTQRGIAATQQNGTLALTDTGRNLLLETVAVTKSCEEDAQSNLAFNEMQILRQLLKRVIRNLMNSDIENKGEA